MAGLAPKLTIKLGNMVTQRFLPDLPALEALDHLGEDLFAEFHDVAIDLINSGKFLDLVARPTEIAGELRIEFFPSDAYRALLAAVAARQHELSGGGHG